MKKLVLFPVLCLFSVGCKTPPRGALVKLTEPVGFTLVHSKLTIHNDASQHVTVIPFLESGTLFERISGKHRNGYTAEYQTGKRRASCLWLCRKKIPTRVFAIESGGRLTVPVILNHQFGNWRIKIGLLIREKNKNLGIYTFCINNTNFRHVSKYKIWFDDWHLQRLKNQETDYGCDVYPYPLYR